MLNSEILQIFVKCLLIFAEICLLYTSDAADDSLRVDLETDIPAEWAFARYRSCPYSWERAL